MSLHPSTIRTKRLVIKPFTEANLSHRYVAWLNDYERMRYSEQRHKRHTSESCRQYFNSFQNSVNKFWAIETIDDGLGHIGNITAHIDSNNNIADIGILIGEKDAAGKGYGYETFQGIVHYLFNTMDIRKVTAGTVSANSAMMKIMHKMNMKEDGIRKRHYIIKGKEVDIIHMALFKDEYTHGR